jgi:oxalate---CoA ligase
VPRVAAATARALLDVPTIRALIATQATERTDSTYLVAVRDGESLSFQELADSVASGPAKLGALGVAAPATVGMLVADPLLFARCFLAGMAAGLWMVPLDPSTPEDALAALTSPTAVRRVQAVISDRPVLEGIETTWIDAGTFAEPDPIVSAEFVTDEGGVILSSSGTTGVPKVVSLSAAHLVATATLVARALELQPTDRAFNSLPLWHVNAEVVGLLAALVAGSSVALDPGFHRTGFWSQVEETGATWVNAVPAIIARLATLRPNETVPSRVRLVRSASSPLSPVIQARFESATGVPVVQSYGMTEAASQICSNPPGPGRKLGSVGPPIGVDVRIVSLDVNDEPTSTPVIGHVEILGPTVITQYDVAGYEDRFDDVGWLRTGDLGFVDPDGYLFLVGRSDDVINRSGEKIYPREIEDVMLAVDGVHTVAVVGEADEVYGEVPVAYLQLEGVDESTALIEIVQACERIEVALKSALPRVRRPARLHVSSRLPAHAVGKVSSSALRKSDVAVLYRHDVA